MVVAKEWTGKLGFIVSLAGAAVGLGNIWRFPYLVSQGGGLFILLYAISMLILVLPVMYFEICMGKYAKRSPLSAFSYVNKTYKVPKMFYGIGLVGIAVVFITLSFYSVVSGWVLYYVFQSYNIQEFDSMASSISIWQNFIANPKILILCTVLFLFMNWIVLANGVQKGLERLNKLLIPLLFVILIAMLCYTGYLPNYSPSEAAYHLMRIDIYTFNKGLFMDALGQALFTLAVGAGAIMTYGAYLPQSSHNILSTSYIIIFVQLTISLLIGVVIYSIVLANQGVEFEPGPSMIFITLPVFLAQMPYAEIVSCTFFVITFFAAITSSINIAEPMIFTLEDKFKFSRIKSVSLIMVIMSLTSTSLALSLNVFSDVSIFDRGIFDTAIISVTNCLMPVAAFLFSIYAGWFLSEHLLVKFTQNKKSMLYYYLRFSLRYVFPVTLLIVQLHI